ncbi:MAG: hypothetical protein V1872_04925 [bacterium]
MKKLNYILSLVIVLLLYPSIVLAHDITVFVFPLLYIIEVFLYVIGVLVLPIFLFGIIPIIISRYLTKKKIKSYICLGICYLIFLLSFFLYFERDTLTLVKPYLKATGISFFQEDIPDPKLAAMTAIDFLKVNVIKKNNINNSLLHIEAIGYATNEIPEKNLITISLVLKNEAENLFFL